MTSFANAAKSSFGSPCETGEPEEHLAVPCFTKGAQIATKRGMCLVEDLQVGDLVLTRDNGYQPVVWVGRRELSAAEMAAKPKLRPVTIAKGALGNGLPARDLTVSPNHRILLTNMPQLLLDEDEVLIAARHLVGKEGVTLGDLAAVTYIHFMCEQHEIVWSDGAWTESFQPQDNTVAGLDADCRDELFALFPSLAAPTGRNQYGAARRIVRQHDAALVQI